MSDNGKTAFMAMPRRAPLEMIAQDFGRQPVHHAPAPDRSGTSFYWRLALFVPALIGTVLLMRGIYGWFSETGMAGLEWFLLSLIGLTFIWVSLSVSTIGIALAGLLARASDAQRVKRDAAPMDVALLMPIYNEATSDVFGNAAAMLDDLARQKAHHRYTLFILSDTRDPQTAAREERAYGLLQATAPAGIGVYYRRRAENTDKKVGNLMDWITGWGAAHDAMVVLDADSLMTGQAIDRLAYELSADPQAALIQTCPVLIGAETLFARLQQFSNIAYGWLMSEGLANWARTEGNYWGHNAIIRTRAFAACAGLPRLARRGGRSDLIFSHDFVEAGLLRRAGWRVRFMPRLTGSFEETPGTLIDYVLRDQRWCRGNLQHLRLLGTAGLHPVSRFHLLHGAVSYLLSPAWFVLLIVWSLLGKDRDTNVIRYFNEANPLFPDWPPAMSHIDSAVFLVIMYAMLLTPKLVGAGIIATHPKATRLYGGRRAFLSAFGVEVFLSIAYAPILMIQQTRAVVRTAIGREMTWAAQNRTATAYPLRDLLRFHWMETVIGLVLTAGLLSGLVSLWLIPIAASLLLAVPLSAASALPVARYLPGPLRMHSPLTLREPGIVQNARRKRLQLLAVLDRPHHAAE
ncbi:glucans biosynthesis glucosyltransferase MdoH [Roseobacter denitrificans]|uniref:Glucans biosynthesis glucosyltransferase H n=1 Tax=Roseobacter denitrificans (strain ATCC 33942 / OCh 114) TaxID=375451 RepID=Q169Q0_ROSDO|nr:glucans biosynthesis glucosyltransferase MdoH [Roseobacter denitrificans]ABG31293.1 glucans biosynthesis glucosyltransferase H, putative [Roseobacter denitrificans OCh 114]AVL54336.1 glucans biosynthesis glucosyltransferase MdoH [Roseobacter denitrificans]SFF99101.1 membrane glycosyltransferase [Roseobacter denitrificans OCh 114]